ncbi:D-inositol 3-phosphate glycosyltransferase [Abditibacteriota bacterium]|nr:D-inositol 3-phosphate glycosyltransferase [Abditibacteriota bacterium]
MPPRFESPFRIARVSTRPAVGGAAAHVALLVKHFHAPDFPTMFLSGCPERSEGDFYELRAPDERRPTTVPALRREPDIGRDVRALRDLVRHFRALRPHLVDTHLSKAGILGRFAARLTRVPLVMHTFHVNIFEGYSWNSPQRALYLRLEQVCARWSNRLICLSDDLGAELIGLGIGQPSQWQTIRLGLELDGFDATPEHRRNDREQLRRELALPSETPLVGVIARLAPVKGLKFLLDAAPAILNAVPRTHFVIAGDGPSRERLETQTREMNLSGRVHFLGMRADVAALYRAFDCMALPSLQEGTPISLIEALAARAPVVASDVGGVSLLVRHERTGLLVAPRDSDALAQAVVRVLKSPEESRHFGEEGRTQMCREWSATRLVEDHRALYARLWQESQR